MKSPHKLQISFDEMTGRYLFKKATVEAYNKLKKMGKNPHLYGDNKIRVSHRGRYFDYSPGSGLWIYTRSSGRHKWNRSKSVEDFMNQMDKFMDWFEKQEIERGNKKITYAELLEKMDE